MTGIRNNNLFADIPAELPEELETLLTLGHQFRLQRIVSRGHASPPDFWYDQDEAEWLVLLSGAATVAFADGRSPATLGPGDTLFLPAHCRHRVDWTAPDRDSVWLALYFQPNDVMSGD